MRVGGGGGKEGGREEVKGRRRWREGERQGRR